MPFCGVRKLNETPVSVSAGKVLLEPPLACAPCTPRAGAAELSTGQRRRVSHEAESIHGAPLPGSLPALAQGDTPVPLQVLASSRR